MKMAKVLKKLIEDSGYNISQFSKKCGVPASTISTMLKNGVGKANVNNVIAMCNALGISVEELKRIADGDEQSHTIAAHFDGTGYTEEELEEIKQFAKFVKEKRK